MKSRDITREIDVGFCGRYIIIVVSHRFIDLFRLNKQGFDLIWSQSLYSFRDAFCLTGFSIILQFW